MVIVETMPKIDCRLIIWKIKRNLNISWNPWNLCLPRFVKTLKKGRNIGTLPWKFSMVGSIQALAEKGGDYIHGPTCDDVIKDVDLSQKTCLITGGASGIGLEISRCLLSRNCNTLMACRNTYAANVAMKNKCDNIERLSIYETNLASLASVKNCTDNLLKDQKKIDIVLLNAAVFGLPWTVTKDGLETIFQVNFLSQYYLLMNIEPILAPDARVVLLSTESHRNIKFDYRNISTPTEETLSLPEDKYTSIKAYNISKLCGLLTMHYLGYRWLNSGKSIFAAHPGSFIKTGLCTNWWPYEMLYTIMLPFTKTIAQAASTPLYCATSPALNGLSSLYYKDCKECKESDLAMDSHLSFKIIDLVRNMLKERVGIAIKDEVVEHHKERIYDYNINSQKKTMDETLISNYSS